MKLAKYNILFWIMLLVIVLMVTCIIAEALLRNYDLNTVIDSKRELKSFRIRPYNLPRAFTIDPSFGFRPILGNKRYNEYGTKVNSYPIEKSPNIKRILFMGDSVTARGMIIDNLKQLYGMDNIEYWNAGVEAFNTIQEVEFYKRYNKKIKPDQVILFFHNNDFVLTPVVFVNQEGKHVIYAPNAPVARVYRWLFKYSYLYRLVFIKRFIHSVETEKHQIVDETRRNLKSLRNDLAKNNIDFTVVVLPIMKDPEEWSNKEKKSRDTIIKVLQDLYIHYIDLYDSLVELPEGIVLRHDSVKGHWHPDREASFYFAKDLYENNLLKQR